MTRDELINAVFDQLTELPSFLQPYPAAINAVIDALDALNMGPKRVAKLEKALRESTAMLERIAAGREWGAIEEQVDDNRAALKGQDNE